MGLRRVICSVILLAAIADFALGQGYEGRRRRPVNPGHPSGCPPVCSLSCPYGLQSNSRGCSICRCNPGPIIEPFPPTPVTPCPPRTEIDRPARVCTPFSDNRMCANGAFCGGGPADLRGYCCRRITQNVHCPVEIRKCVRRGTDYCSAHRPCPGGFKCCRKDCSMQCVPANGELYRPRIRGRGMSMEPGQ